MRKNDLLRSILFFTIILISQQAKSQCAMCKSVVEANLENGGTIGAGLNDGILYLMAMPYISIIVISLVWYNLKKGSKS